MAWVVYDSYLKGLLTETDVVYIEHETDTFKIAMTTVTYTPNRATHQHFDNITNEVTGTNYTAGGNACANPAVTVSANVIKFDSDDPTTWSQSGTGFSDARIAVLYKDTGTAATSNLVAYNDFGASKGNVDGDFTIELDADGIATLGSA